MSDMQKLEQRVAALEASLAEKAGKKAADVDEDDEKKASLRSEIAALEKRLGADDDDDDGCKAAEEEKTEEKTASEIDPSGIEEEITNDRHREVERLQHGTELATDTMMLQVAPTRSEYQARLKLASARLDRVANYLEKNGRRELAFRIDKIADAIDDKVKQEEK